MVYRMFFVGRHFVSRLLCTLKAKNPKNCSRKPIFPALVLASTLYSKSPLKSDTQRNTTAGNDAPNSV